MTTETIVTGIGWMGTGIRSVQSTLKQMLREANQEVLISVYSITEGADEILQELGICLQRGLVFKIIINRFYNQFTEIQTILLELIKIYPNFKVYSFDHPIEQLHAKFIVVDRSIALVGSANLSLRGMKKNYELGILLNNDEVITIAKCFDQLTEMKSVSLISHIANS